MTITFNGGTASTTASYDNLPENRLRTTSLTQTEIATIEGDRFSAQYSAVIPAGVDEELVVQFTMPDNTRLTGFVLRTLQANQDMDFELYWDPTGVVKGASIPIFNENQLDNSPSLMDYTEVTSYTTEGTLRETDFLVASVPGASKTSGEISGDVGFRIYDPNRVALIKLINKSTENCRILLTYTWIEKPTT